jgi:signal transduction histidine kinase
MPRFKFGIRAKFITLILVILTAIFCLIATYMIRTNASSLRTDLRERSRAFATLATKPIGNTFSIYNNSGKSLVDQQVTHFTDLDQNITNVAVVNIDGTFEYTQHSNVASITTAQAATFDPIFLKSSSGTVTRIIYPYIDDSGAHSYAVVYDISSAGVDRAVRNLIYSILGFAVFGLLFSAVTIYLLINRLFLSPIKKVRDSALLISTGEYTQQISLTQHDEIGDLATSINQMADSLKADIQKLKELDQLKSEFMMIASHNLRTPISIISGYVDTIKTQDMSDVLRKMIDNISANTQRLNLFAEDILIIASMESGAEKFYAQPIAVSSVFNTLVEEFKVLAAQKNIAFNVSLARTDATILGSATHLRSAVWNLLENALVFNKEAGSIEFSTVIFDNFLEITVRDNGIGIRPEEMPKLFTKFHRGTSTLDYNYEGTGIGLYITKLVVVGHKGTIHVDSTLGKGTAFIIRIPLADVPPSENIT